jgi:hypothetical protein
VISFPVIKLNMSAESKIFLNVLNNPNLKRKCLGIAKNYFTQALKKDASSVKIPPYPFIF